MAATSLPVISSHSHSQKSSGHSTPRGSCYKAPVPGGSVSLPGVRVRNPIIGNTVSYIKNYNGPGVRRSVPAYYGPRDHERSMFLRTDFGSSYYIIHPDWTSEAAGMRRLQNRQPSYYAWDNRPAMHPLSGMVERRSRGDYQSRELQDYLQGKLSESYRPDPYHQYSAGNQSARF